MRTRSAQRRGRNNQRRGESSQGGHTVGWQRFWSLLKQHMARRLAATLQSHMRRCISTCRCASKLSAAAVPAACRTSTRSARHHTSKQPEQGYAFNPTTMKTAGQRTAVPRVHCLHGEARRGLRERQHKAQGVDGEVQTAALHRHNVHLLRRAGCDRQNGCQCNALCEWVPCTVTMLDGCAADDGDTESRA